MTEALLLPSGLLRFQGQNYRAALGRAGVSPTKHEGDGITPLTVLPLRRVFYRADRIAKPRCAKPVEALAPNEGWCDDPRDPNYNRMVRLPYAANHEALWREDPLYDLIGVLGWNDAPVERGRGSAIFLHVATPDYAPTAGCVALALGDLLAILAAGLTAIRVHLP
jgi:L,D-peptidoglycan transpeptidase YkuD (ErfK/YbiS/YcfS/YnhG family)